MKKTFIFVTTLIILAGMILFFPATTALVISNRKNQSEKIITRAGFENGFIISYTHSVNKGRVHDYYKSAEKNQLELYQTEFVSYGAGIPEPYETPGAVFEVTDDGYFIKNLHRVLPRLVMAVGVIANHSITIGSSMTDSRELFLTEYFPPQTSLIFENRRVSLFDIITNKNI